MDPQHQPSILESLQQTLAFSLGAQGNNKCFAVARDLEFHIIGGTLGFGAVLRFLGRSQSEGEGCGRGECLICFQNGENQDAEFSQAVTCGGIIISALC